jgi:hypothetical protein
VELLYLRPLYFERCTIAISSVTTTNAIRTLTYCDYIKINSIKFFAANEYSNLNSVLFSVVLDEYLPDAILICFDCCHRIYFQSYESFTINSMSYNMSLLCGIKLHHFPVSSFKLHLKEEEDIIWDNDIIELGTIS